METRIEPADFTPDDFKRIVSHEVRPVLISNGGDVKELPKPLNDLLVSVVDAMQRGEAVFIMHENEAFTTQAAANFLGISRQFLVRLLEKGEMPYHHAGSHRRVFFKDLVRYRQERSRVRRAKLDSMTEELVEAGVYDTFIPVEQDDSED